MMQLVDNHRYGYCCYQGLASPQLQSQYLNTECKTKSLLCYGESVCLFVCVGMNSRLKKLQNKPKGPLGRGGGTWELDSKSADHRVIIDTESRLCNIAVWTHRSRFRTGGSISNLSHLNWTSTPFPFCILSTSCACCNGISYICGFSGRLCK